VSPVVGAGASPAGAVPASLSGTEPVGGTDEPVTGTEAELPGAVVELLGEFVDTALAPPGAYFPPGPKPVAKLTENTTTSKTTTIAPIGPYAINFSFIIPLLTKYS
jgi:hypothetical protein